MSVVFRKYATSILQVFVDLWQN